jgi:hypothetical protein
VDSRVGVREGYERLGSVHDPAAFSRQPLQPEALAVPDKDRGCGTVYFEDEARTGH